MTQNYMGRDRRFFIIDDPRVPVPISAEELGTLVHADYNLLEGRYMLTCPEVVDMRELSVKEPTPHQGKPKKNYHLLNDQHINRRRRK